MVTVTLKVSKTTSLLPPANAILRSSKKHSPSSLQLITDSRAVPDQRAVSVSRYNEAVGKATWALEAFLSPVPQAGRTTACFPERALLLGSASSFLHCHFTSFNLIFSLSVLAYGSKTKGIFTWFKAIILKHYNLKCNSKTSMIRHYKVLSQS